MSVFNISVCEHIEESKYLKDVKEINRPIYNHANNQKSLNYLLTLNLNNDFLTEIIDGDIFYDKKSETFILFFVIKENGVIKDLFFYNLKKSDYEFMTEKGLNESYSEFRNKNLYVFFQNFLYYGVEKITIQDIKNYDLHFLTNLYYQKNIVNYFESDELVFLKKQDKKTIVSFLNVFLECLIQEKHNIEIIYKLKNKPKIFYSKLVDSEFYFKEKMIESFRPMVLIELKINSFIKDNRSYLDSIYIDKEKNEIFLVKMNEDFKYEIIDINKKNIKNDIFKNHLSSKAYNMYSCVNNDENKYNKYYFLFI